MKKYIIGASILISTLILDIFTKHLIVQNFSYSDRVDYLGGFLRITLVYNEGGVFGILQGYKTLFLVVSIVVLLLMIVYIIFEKNKTLLFIVPFSLIISGALGNIIDRLIPGRPGVVDFISLGVDGYFRWPAFNVADSCIVVGAFIFGYYIYLEEKKAKHNAEGQGSSEI
jgi:signal peptidase II